MPSTDRLTAALSAKRESKTVDFKSSFDPESNGDWCELIKDFVAIANSGGGVILIGVADDGTASGTNARNEEFGMRSAELRNTLPTGRISAFGGCGLMSPLLTRGLVQVNAVVDTVAAVAGVPEGFAEQDLGLGVLGPVGAHHARDGFGLWRGRSFVADIHR